MLRIRFPNGQCIQYNDATEHDQLANGDTQIVRVTEGKRFWVALITKGTSCVIEHVQPCLVTNPLQSQAPATAFKTVMQHLRTLPAHQVRELKNALRDFNARSRAWRT